MVLTLSRKAEFSTSFMTGNTRELYTSVLVWIGEIVFFQREDGLLWFGLTYYIIFLLIFTERNDDKVEL